MRSKFFTLLLLVSNIAFANEFIPSYLLRLDSQFAHHVVVVEKSTHKLYIYENNNSKPKLIKTFKVATGKIEGNKNIQGDKKTPEGIYRFNVFHSAEDLIKMYGKTGLIYGAGAFTLNYPNVIDRRTGKTGGGIWLHSTDDDARVDKGLDSRGCVVAIDGDLKNISEYIDLENTPAIIVQNQEFLKQSTWQDSRFEIQEVVNTWINAWVSKDFETYISQYSRDFYNARKGAYNRYKAYKRAVFARNDTPEISISNLSILKFKNYAVVTMEQKYNSKVIQDAGKKILYLEQDSSYNWKIISENWYSLPKDYGIAFEPKQRFFLQKKNNSNREEDRVVEFSNEEISEKSTN